jgi:hypothetical protein
MQSLGRSAGRTSIRLQRATWCDASGLVAIACIAERETRRGRDVVLHQPASADVANYLSVMGLGRVLDELGVTHDLRTVRDRGADTLLPLQRFEEASGASTLAEHVYDTVEHESKRVAAALYIGLCEAGENVPQHSGRSTGYLAAQRYPGDGRFLFAVGDSGRGMLKALAPRGATTHEEAIKLALTVGGTGTDDASRGNGIPDVLANVAKLRGNLLVASGTASVTRGRPGRGRTTTSEMPFLGTVLRGTVRTSRGLGR